MQEITRMRRLAGLGRKNGCKQGREHGILQETEAMMRKRTLNPEFDVIEEISQHPTRKGEMEEVERELVRMKTKSWTMSIAKIMEILEVEVEPETREEKQRIALMRKVVRAQQCKGLKPEEVMLNDELTEIRIKGIKIRKVKGFIQGIKPVRKKQTSEIDQKAEENTEKNESRRVLETSK